MSYIKNILITALLLLLLSNTNLPSFLSANSLGININKDKEILLTYNKSSKIYTAKELLKSTNKLENSIKNNLIDKKRLSKGRNAKVIKRKGVYTYIKAKNKQSINTDKLKYLALLKSQIEIEIVESQPDFTNQEAEILVEKLNGLQDHKLQIKLNDEIINEFDYEPLYLFKNGTDEIDLYSVYSLVNYLDKKYSSSSSNLYLNFQSKEAHGFLKDGKKLDYRKTIENLQTNIDQGKLLIEPIFNNTKGYVIDENGIRHKYNKQGIGKSNYSGSDWGRSKNVELGTKNLISHVLVNPKEQVSFLSLLKTKGYNIPWELAKVIKKGGELVLEPGGGLCQVSTTLFRAALQSGMTIDQWRNHSLYVRYYKAFGNGLDSTIYPPYVDLKFTNPYNFPVIFQSYTNQDKDVIVEILSPKSTSKVSLVGPFYKGDKENLRSNQILWERKTYFPLYTRTEEFKSSYNTSVGK